MSPQVCLDAANAAELSPVSQLHDTLRTALKRIAPLRHLVRAARAWLDARRIDLWAVDGPERVGGERLRALLGGHLQTKNYVGDRLFADGASQRHHRAWYARLPAAARGARPDLVLLDTTDRSRLEALAGDAAIWMRGWVRTELELAHARERMHKSDGIKSDLRKVKTNGLEVRVATGAGAFERFYRELYLPYALAGFSDRAVYMTAEQFQEGCRNAELLEVHRAGTPIAGMVVLYPPQGAPHWWVLGVRDGDRALLAQGVLAALYGHAVQHLAAAGFERALLGGVRPFLADGVLQYKRKWGARLVPGDDGDPHWLMLKIVEATAAVRDALSACPLIGEDEPGLVGYVFRTGTAPMEETRLAHQQAELAALGVARVVVRDFGGAPRR